MKEAVLFAVLANESVAGEGKHFGGERCTRCSLEWGKFALWVREESIQYMYDITIIGGGIVGLAIRN